MDCHVCEVVQAVGPYVLVAVGGYWLHRTAKKFREHLLELHARFFDVTERHAGSLEKIHCAIVDFKKKDEAIDIARKR
jgi:hypothetical protein